MECEVRLIGNVGQNPELHKTSLGIPVCNVRVATDAVYKDSTGKIITKTEWHDVVCFGKTAEAFVKNKKKGDQIAVSGTLSSDRVKDPNFRDSNGNPCEKIHVKIIASKIHYLGKPSRSS